MPVTISSSPKGRVIGGSARARHPERSHNLQAGPMGTVKLLDGEPGRGGTVSP